MAAAVIDALLAESRSRKIQGVAYLYLNYRQQASPQDLLSSLLRQMADKQTTLPKSVQDLHNRRQRDRTRPSVQELSEVLEMICDQNHEFYFVIDALDEYDSIDRYRFLDMIFKLQQKTSINVLFTSRFIAEITEAFQHAIRFEIRASDKDVEAYLTSRLDDLRIVRNKKDLREEIKETIVERVQGMFLLAQLHMDSLADCTTINTIKAELSGLPSGSQAYDKSYSVALNRIKSQTSECAEPAMKVLCWVTCAKRLLRLRELEHALAVKLGSASLDEDDVP
jgi:hypothetical protein